MKKIILLACVLQLVSMPVVRAAIQYGGGSQQASFAASTTKQVGELLDKAVSGGLTTAASSSTTEQATGVLGSVGRFFAGINTWLKEKAGINFFGILKGIGSFFLIVIEFVVDLLRKVL
jgi:hypothetical protein